MQKQAVLINFSKGLDLKTDPWQLPIGKFEDLQNSIFQKGGLLLKRPGYLQLTSQNPNSNYVTTLNGNLMAVGDTISAYSSSLGEWITKGQLAPCSLSVLPLIRNSLSQTQCDAVVANGMVLTTWMQTNTTTSTVTVQAMFAIADSTTGQNIVEPTAIPPLSTGAILRGSKVFVVSNSFVIVSPVLVSGTTSLQYCSLPISSPVNTTTNVANISAPQNVDAEAFVPIFTNSGWDGVVTQNNLVLAYNATSGGQGVHVTVLTAANIAANAASGVLRKFTNAVYIGALVAVCCDFTSNPNVIYISFWNNSNQITYTAAVTIGFGTINVLFNPTLTNGSNALANISSAAQNGSCLVLLDEAQAYSYQGGTFANHIEGVTVSSSGSIGTPYDLIRSIGLGSKGFIVDGTIYFLGAFSSQYQPTFFLINASLSTQTNPVIVAKLAYQNGGGVVSTGLPSVTVSGTTAQVSYLVKDTVQALTVTGNSNSGGIYSQTGVNLATFSLGTTSIDTSEIAQNLHISGGYLSQFDGYLPVEHNFFLFPEPIKAVFTENSTVTPTGTWSSGATSITVSNATGIAPGMFIGDTSNATYIPSGTTVVTVSGTTVTLSAATTHSATNDNLSINGSVQSVPGGSGSAGQNYFYQCTYEWTDNQGLAHRSAPSIPLGVTTTGTSSTAIITLNVPTLRLTSKINNPPKIVIYRWSVTNQNYHQVTSITAPILNDTTVDYITFVDVLPDSSIVGNDLIYTTGGVVPDCNAPAFNVCTLFDTRLVLVSAEDPNTLWISKQVIEQTPVEMSQEFTIYVAPNTGTVTSTGPLTALGPMDSNLIMFKKQAIFYINGVGPNDLGTTSAGCSLGNYSQPIFITGVVGCTNQQSIVLTPDGLMFQSDKGIWLLGRNLQTSYIGAPVEAFNSSTVTSANVIPETNYVLFTLNTGEILMYDYYYGQWGTFTGAPAVSSCIYNGAHTLLSPRGAIMQATPGTYLDGASPVLMKFKTSWINIASLQGYERFYEFLLLGRFLSQHQLLVQVAYDYNSSYEHQKLITPTNTVQITPSPFGIPVPFGVTSDKEQWRVHAKRQLCESFQITVTEVYDSNVGVAAGAGFTMSGINAQVGIKKASKPIRGSNTAGVS